MHTRTKTGFTIMAACVTLMGCAGIYDPVVGRGPITLSADAEKAFAEYRTTTTPRYFALSTDGSAYYYSFCDIGRCRRDMKTSVIDKCQSFSHGVPCLIYASRGQVIWQVARPPR